jgi:uncharacterized protein with GYD domain
MPLYITQGRFTADAVKGMIAKPEDRATAVAALAEKAGGKLLSYYVTFGEYDFLVVAEAPDSQTAAAVVLAAAAGGGVTDLKTTAAFTSAQAKECFAQAGRLAAGFKSAGKG